MTPSVGTTTIWALSYHTVCLCPFMHNNLEVETNKIEGQNVETATICMLPSRANFWKPKVNLVVCVDSPSLTWKWWKIVNCAFLPFFFSFTFKKWLNARTHKKIIHIQIYLYECIHTCYAHKRAHTELSPFIYFTFILFYLFTHLFLVAAKSKVVAA